MKNSKNVVFIDRSIESVNLILKEVEKSTVLNPEEEDKLWKQMREGSSVARNKLINSNLRFVLSRVTKYMWSSVSLEDLFQAGTIGLMEAIDMFDASQGVKLISFAKYYIDSEIQRLVTPQQRLTNSVSLSETAFDDEDSKLTMEEVVSSGRQDYADWGSQYDAAFQEMKAVVRKVAPFEDAANLWVDYIVMKEQGYALSDVARMYRITEEQAKEAIKTINMRLHKHYGLRV